MYFQRLKDLREDRGLLQKDIALILKISERQYVRWEKGDIPILARYLITLADFYSTSMDYILDRTNEINPYPNNLRDSGLGGEL